MSCCGPQSCRNFDDDREGVSDADLARFGGDDIECPKCGADVYFDATACPRCRHVMTEASTARRMPTWIPLTAATIVLCILLLTML